MLKQLKVALCLASVLILSSACMTTTEVYSKTIGSSSDSFSASSKREAKRNKKQESVETYVQLGVGYLSKNNRKQARSNLLKALEIDERSAGAHNGMALLYQLEKENDLAEEHFKKAMSYEPELTRVRYNYAVFLFRQQRYADAHQQFLLVSEDLNYEYRARVFYNIGLTAQRLGKTEEAREAWDKSISLNPSQVGPYLELADVHFRGGDYPKAKYYLDRYESLAKPSPRVLWLGVRLERAFGNKDGEASKGLALRKMFPYSKENLAYTEWLKTN